MKKVAVLLGVATVALGIEASAFGAEIHYATNPVHGSWIVEVEASVGRGAPMEALAHSLAASRGGEVGFRYDGRLRGFVLRVPDQAVAGLAHHPLIKNLIQDERYEGILSEAAPHCYPRHGMQHMSNTRPLPGNAVGSVQILECTEPEIGSGGPTCIDNWGLDRIGEESLPPDYRYQWPENGGDRRIYVFDTGVRSSHREFDGVISSRVVHLFNATGEPAGDFYGHGTHVAAIAAGRTYGVAKWASIYEVKILEDSDTTPPSTYLSWMLAGLQAIRSHMTSDPPTGIAVLNWSGGNNENFVTGVDKQYVLIRQELVGMLEEHDDLLLVQSAGNTDGEACNNSFGDDDRFPTVFDQILIAGGSDTSDRRLSFSNKGECVDLFAPAAFVVSAFKSFDSAACELSGTSMAAPHASGVAAVLSGLFPSEDAAGIRDLVIASATLNVLDPATLGEGSPNLLLSLPAGDGVIFDDDFTGLGNWPINVTTGDGQNSVCSGYCASIESAADTAYLGDTRPDDEYVYRVAFQLSADDLIFGPNSEAILFRARGAGESTLFEISLKTGPGGFQEMAPMLRVVAQTNSGAFEELVELPQPGAFVDPTLQLEFEWVPSAFSSEPEGFFRLWGGFAALQNVQLLISLDDLATFGMTVDSALLGIVGASGWVEGELQFSDFKSRREDLAISF